ncbi:MAG: OmpA family protein, partial [Bacteroidales bacterium]|nr:OmpA family protein [Bacteroidales bacterium]
RIYVSLDEKLLFQSGKWNVDARGKQAIRQLSGVLAANKDIDILVEGHTDNVPYGGNGHIIDNWDLSVMRATSVVKALLKNKNISPRHITASGKAGFDPKAAPRQNPNINSRTEIIITPKYVDIIDILSAGKDAAATDIDTQTHVGE